jgi:hypothetical protein
MKTDMDDKLLDAIYNVKELDIHQIEDLVAVGRITEKDKFVAAKQILLGLAILYVLTIIAYLLRPIDCSKLIDICTTTFPPLATLILVAYFRDKSH